MADAVKGAMLVGDLVAAKVAADAMARLLGTAAHGGEAEVVDLEKERERQG